MLQLLLSKEAQCLDRLRLCMKSNVSDTAWSKPARPSLRSFSRVCQSASRFGGFLQPTEHALDDVALPILGPIEQPGKAGLWLALHTAHRNYWLHPVAVTVATQGFGVIALVGLTNGSVYAGARADWEYGPHPAEAEHRQYRWLVCPIA